MKKVKKLLALACVLLLGLSATGCADLTWAVKVDNTAIPAGVYLYYLYINRETVLSKAYSAASAETSSESASSNTLGLGSSSSSSKSSAADDPWSQKIENVNAKDWCVNDALKSVKELAAAEKLCDQKKITLSAAESSNLSAYAQQYMSQYTGFSSNGISQTSLERAIRYNGLYLPKLIQAYYGKSGEKPVSDADLLAYYNSNYADIKQILISSNDDNNNPLTGDALKAAQSSASDVLAQLSANPARYSELEGKYDFDKDGAAAYPQGYIFPKDSTEYIAEFVTGAFSMKVGEVKMIQSSYGWHIMYRVPNDTTSGVYDDSMKAEVLQNMKQADLIKIIDDAVSKSKVVENSKMINHYSPKKLKDT